MIFQEPMVSLNPIMRVGEQAAEGVRAHRKVTRSQARSRVLDVFDAVRLPRPAQAFDLYPHEMSGGMRQRVMIAMALANEPDLLIADEPTTALDVTTQRDIMELLVDLQRRSGLAVLYICHDLPLVSRYADRVSVLYAGVSMETGPARAVIDAPRHPYTRALLACVPGPRAGGALRREIPGEVPSPRDWEIGCRFAPRCDRMAELCGARPVAMSRSTAQAVRCLFPLN
jgi:oligopeptide/dipeptide ABC transporter ATP-binding protein